MAFPSPLLARIYQVVCCRWSVRCPSSQAALAFFALSTLLLSQVLRTYTMYSCDIMARRVTLSTCKEPSGAGLLTEFMPLTLIHSVGQKLHKTHAAAATSQAVSSHERARRRRIRGRSRDVTRPALVSRPSTVLSCLKSVSVDLHEKCRPKPFLSVRILHQSCCSCAFVLLFRRHAPKKCCRRWAAP